MTASRAFTTLSILLGTTLSGMLLSAVALAAYLAGPRMESMFLPILQATPVADSVRRNDQGGICWRTALTKLRPGRPAFTIYLATHHLRLTERDAHGASQMTDLSEPLPVFAYEIDASGRRHDLSRRDFVEPHPPGAHWLVTYCFDKPQDLHLDEPFVVTGEAMYDVAHRLWRVPAELPSFTVLSISALDPMDR